MSVLSGKIADVRWGKLYLEIEIGSIGPTGYEALKNMFDPYIYFDDIIINSIMDAIEQKNRGQKIKMHYTMIGRNLKSALRTWPVMRFLMRACINCPDCEKLKCGRVFPVRRKDKKMHICENCNKNKKRNTDYELFV